MCKKSAGWTDLCLAALMLVLWALSACLPPAGPAAVAAMAGTDDLPAGEGEKLLALTFDDGPRRLTTEKLLDGLARRGVKATFFLIGKQVEGNEDLIRRMEAEGHQVGIHTYDHVTLTGLNGADLDDQVGRARQAVAAVLGHDDLLLRPPYGLVDAGVKAHAGSALILWSIDPEDWRDRDPSRVAAHIVDSARDGGIVLLHDIFPESVEAALTAVDLLLAEGYRFCTVEDLFAARHIQLKAGQVYTGAFP